MSRSIYLLALSFAVTWGCGRANADSWAIPTQKEYWSSGRHFRFRVTPRELTSQLGYFQDTVENRPQAGQGTGGQRRCMGALERERKAGGYESVWATPLLNDVSPVNVVVDPEGHFVATFDNWHSTGYGQHAAVIYGPNGSIVASFSLLDLLTPEEVEKLSMSVSSVRWYESAAFERVASQPAALTIRVQQEDSSGKPTTSTKLRIEAATGKLLRPGPELKRIADHKIQCRAIPERVRTGWDACRAKKLSDVWCSLCGTLREEAAQQGVAPAGASPRR